jgi:hypothetical protein
MAPTPDSDSDGTYHHETALILDLSSDARLGSDSCTNATHKGTRPLRAWDHWHPRVFISEPPGPPLAGPKHLVYSGPLRASCGTTDLEPVRYPVYPGFKFPSNTTVSGSPLFFPIIGTKRDFLLALQTLHHLLGSRRHLLLYFDPCSFAT